MTTHEIKEKFRKALLTDIEINTTNFAKVLKHAFAAIDEAAGTNALDLEIKAFFVELAAFHAALAHAVSVSSPWAGGHETESALALAREAATLWRKERLDEE